MFPVARLRLQVSAVFLGMVLCAAGPVALTGCSGSSDGYSGRYEADMGGGLVVLDFHGRNEVKVSLMSPDGTDAISHNSVYVVVNDKMTITTEEPMGVPMYLVIKDGQLTDGSGMVFEKK